MTPQPKRKQSFSTILGLGLENSRLKGVLLRRKNGHLQVQKTVSIPLDQNSLATNPDEVGRRIRDHLHQAGIRESRCAISLPLDWTSTVATAIPDLPEEDVASFIELEAERGFLFAQDSLSICHSRIRLPGGEKFATLVAIPHKNLQHWDRVLKAAKLRSVSFTPGLTVLQPPASEPAIGVLALLPTDHGIDLQITLGGGVAVLRSIDVLAPGDLETGQVDVHLLVREIRITLGQLPPEQRTLVRTAKIFGQEEAAKRLARDLPSRLESFGITCESVPNFSATSLTGLIPAEQAIEPALAVAAQVLRKQDPAFEFLPPKISAWKDIVDKLNSRKLVWAGAALAGLILLAGGSFAYQEWQLSHLQERWNAMQSKVDELSYFQSEIKSYRPWYDASFRSLRILEGLTQAFPETGVVTAKSIEIRAPSEVTCSGEANDREALLALLDKLNAASEVQELRLDQIRGKIPMQFTFNFQWESGGYGE